MHIMLLWISSFPSEMANFRNQGEYNIKVDRKKPYDSFLTERDSVKLVIEIYFVMFLFYFQACLFWWDFVHLEISQCWHKSQLGVSGNICMQSLHPSYILCKLETWEYFEYSFVWQKHTLAWGNTFWTKVQFCEEHTL